MEKLLLLTQIKGGNYAGNITSQRTKNIFLAVEARKYFMPTRIKQLNYSTKYRMNYLHQSITGLTNKSLNFFQDGSLHIQALVSADGILPIVSSKLQLLIINLASVPGRQLVNAPTAAILERYAVIVRHPTTIKTRTIRNDNRPKTF